MKAKKKRGGTKAQIRATKEKERRIASTVTVALVIIIILVSSFVIYSFFFSSSGEAALPEPTLQFKPASSSSELKAVIVDHLSLTAPNETFMQTAANILTQANYTVDYFSGEKVTVNFYRNLPTGRYNLIVLRVHSALDAEEYPPLALFTSELLDSRKHVSEQLTDQVQGVAFIPYREGDKAYFGILPKFIKQSIKGDFQKSIIVAMGCDGITYTNMAEAFIERKAKAYISWNGPVLASHTDQATTSLLQHLTLEKQTIKQAVENAMKEVGVDPEYDSQLTYYPLKAGDQTIEDIKSNH